MAKGVTGEMKQKLSNLRGEGAKAHADSRKLAETAIMQSALAKEVTKDIKVPNMIPDDVKKLMTDNEMENATIVFGHNAIQLFSYVFGQAMNSAVSDAMSQVAEIVDQAVEKRLTEALNMGANVMGNMLHTMQGGKFEDFLQEFKESNKVVSMKDFMPSMGVEVEPESVEKAQPDVILTKGKRPDRVLKYMESIYPTAVSIPTIYNVVIAPEKKDVSTGILHSLLSTLLKKGKIERVQFGMYRYLP